MRYRSGHEHTQFFLDAQTQANQLLSRANLLIASTNADVTSHVEWYNGNAFGHSVVNGLSAAELVNPNSTIALQAKENIQITLNSLLTDCEDMLAHYGVAKYGSEEEALMHAEPPEHEPELSDIVKKEFAMPASETAPSIFVSVEKARHFDGTNLTRVYVFADMHRETVLLFADDALVHAHQNEVGIEPPESFIEIVSYIDGAGLPHIPLRTVVDLIETDDTVTDDVLLQELVYAYGEHFDALTLSLFIETMRDYVQTIRDAEEFSEQFAPLTAEQDDITEANRLVGIMLADKYW